MKKALITGITGQDGSYLAEFLLEKGYEVHGITRRSSLPNTSRIDHIINRITLHDGDLSDSSSLIRIINIVQPDEIYNLAAQSHVFFTYRMRFIILPHNLMYKLVLMSQSIQETLTRLVY